MSFPPTVMSQIKTLKGRESFTYSTKQDHIKIQLPYEPGSTYNGFKALVTDVHHLR